jgi:glycosyltransferase involved in cell wall biosynthesis
MKINIICYASSDVGLGVYARYFIAHAINSNICISLYDLDSGLGRTGKHADYINLTVPEVSMLPYDINLFILPPHDLDRLRYVNNGQFFCDARVADRFNVALTFWELSVLPCMYLETMQMMDIILYPSQMIFNIFSSSCPGPLPIECFIPMDVPDVKAVARNEYALPDDAVIFICSFDLYSDIYRKNINGVIRAFIDRLCDNEKAWMIIKTNMVVTEYALSRLFELEQLVAKYNRIMIVSKNMDYDEVLSLYRACDVYVSLHRAEGFGLGMYEAMALGMPVIATAWSGNMSFMDSRCACLIHSSLTSSDGSMHSAYHPQTVGSDAMWADPSIYEAAKWMALLINDSDLRKKIGAAARDRIKEWNANALQSKLFEKLEAAIEQKELISSSADLKQKLARYRADRYRLYLPRGFEPSRYLQLHPDVRLAGYNPIFHYINFGAKEGRAF